MKYEAIALSRKRPLVVVTKGPIILDTPENEWIQEGLFKEFPIALHRSTRASGDKEFAGESIIKTSGPGS